MAVWLQGGQVAVQMQGKKGGKVAGFRRRNLWQKTVRGPRVGRQQSRVDRGFRRNRRGLGRGFQADSGGRSAPV